MAKIQVARATRSIGEGLAAEVGEIDAETLEDFQGVEAGGLAAGGANAGADDVDIGAGGRGVCA